MKISQLIKVQSPVAVADTWAPQKDAAGEVLASEFAGLPLNQMVEWLGTSFESQVKPPYGQAADYKPGGNNPIGGLMGAFTGMAWDEIKGDAYHFGGGHADSAFNAVTKYSAARGEHSIVIPPTHQRSYPPGYGNYTTAPYASGKSYNYFPVEETPAGDDKPCSSHTWSGLIYVPGIEEVLMPRNGWFHAKLNDKSWRVGPQEGKRLGFTGRGGIGFHSHYLPSTGMVYLTSEGGAAGGTGNGYYEMVVYDPVKREEVGVIGWDAGNYLSSSCLVGEELWYFQKGYGYAGCAVSTVNLKTGASIRGRTPCTGRWPDFDDGSNPCQYIPELDKIVMWCTQNGGPAQKGDMLTFDRKALKFEKMDTIGTSPVPGLMNNKMRYWPKHKVLVFQLATNLNTRVMRLG